MEKYELRIFASKQAMYYGLWFGLFLIIRFALEMLVSGMPGAFLSGMMSIAIPILAYIFTKTFRDKVADSEYGFGIIFRFCIYMFFFASMLLAVAYYVYLQYINPDFMQQQVDLVIEGLGQIPSYAPVVEEFKNQVDTVGLPSASVVAVQVIWIYLLLGIILGLPIAAIVNRKK